MELMVQILPGDGEDLRTLHLSTSLSGRTQTVVNCVNSPPILKEGELFEKTEPSMTWLLSLGMATAFKESQIFSLPSTWQLKCLHKLLR